MCPGAPLYAASCNKAVAMANTHRRPRSRIHSGKFRQLNDFTEEGVMSYLREHHPPTHDVTRHAESRFTAKTRDVTLGFLPANL